MRLTIRMGLDNAAFETDSETQRDGHDIAYCLQELADQISTTYVSAGARWLIRDASGNDVGIAEILEDA